MFGFDSFFLVFPRFFVFLGSETQKKSAFVVLNGYDQSRSQK